MAVATSGQSTGFTLSTTSTAVCAQNAYRKGIHIINLDPSITVYASFGNNGVATTTNGIPIPGQGNLLYMGGGAGYSAGFGGVVPQGDIALIALSGSPKVVVLEF